MRPAPPAAERLEGDPRPVTARGGRTVRQVVARLVLGTAVATVLGATAAAVALGAGLQQDTARRAAAADLAAVAGVAEVTADRDDLRRALGRLESGREGRAAVLLPGGAVGRTATGGEVLSRTVEGPAGAVTVQVQVRPAGGPGQAAAIAVAVAVASALTTGAGLLVARRHAARAERELAGLVATAHALGSGDFTAHAGSAELVELDTVARGLNAVSDRVAELREAEHRMVADLSHRLRTPLTALSLDAGALDDGPLAERIRTAVTALDHDVDALIRTAAPGHGPVAPRCDVVEVVRSRMEFWSALGAHHQRRAELHLVPGPATIALPADDLAAVLDALLGNVFRYTPVGAGFAVRVVRHAGWVTVVVDDGGPGVADPAAALRRGVSGTGSTGLGLAIARSAVESTGGTLHLERSAMGGTRVRMRFGEAGPAHHDVHEPRAWRLWSGALRRGGSGSTAPEERAVPG